MSAPFFREPNGQEHALGPQEAALVRAVLRAAARCRQQQRYQIHLHVKHLSVVAQVLIHVGDDGYEPPD